MGEGDSYIDRLPSDIIDKIYKTVWESNLLDTLCEFRNIHEYHYDPVRSTRFIKKTKDFAKLSSGRSPPGGRLSAGPSSSNLINNAPNRHKGHFSIGALSHILVDHHSTYKVDCYWKISPSWSTCPGLDQILLHFEIKPIYYRRTFATPLRLV